MKRTVPQAVWPLPATPKIQPPTRPARTISRVTLALLDEYSEQKRQGYDPYDTRPTHTRRDDPWRRKPKRD